MTKPLHTIIAAAGFAASIAVALHAQDAAPPAAPKTAAVPLKLQIVITRYQGDKKISSLPYTLSVTANDFRGQGSSLRMGAQVPIVTVKTPAADSKDPPAGTVSYQYRDVGTNIDCNAISLEEGRFRIGITIDDSSVLADEPVAQQGLASGRPSFRSFRTNQVLLLKDGQSTQFITATDKVNGEVVKVDVTLTVVK